MPFTPTYFLNRIDTAARIKETRMSLAQDTAVTMLPMTLGLWVFACLLYRGTVDGLQMPHPDVLVIKRRGGVEVRHKRRAVG